MNNASSGRSYSGLHCAPETWEMVIWFAQSLLKCRSAKECGSDITHTFFGQQPVTVMAVRRSATLTLNSTGPPATGATVPTAKGTQMAPTVRGAGRISSASGTAKPARPVTVVPWVSDSQSQHQPDGLKDKTPHPPRKQSSAS